MTLCHLPRTHSPAGADEPDEHEASLFDQLCAASIQGGAVLALESSRPIARLGQRRPPRPPPLPGSLCADRDGFSLHAKVLVPAGELERLEHLCRYIARPPIATQRLALAPDGRVIYGLKRHWRDGTSAVSFDPLTFIERLAARILFATTPRRRCDSSLRDEPRLTCHPHAPTSSPTVDEVLVHLPVDGVDAARTPLGTDRREFCRRRRHEQGGYVGCAGIASECSAEQERMNEEIPSPHG